MKILLKRESYTKGYTHGKLFIDGAYFCDTLEDEDRFLEKNGVKIPSQTCIPRGTYKLELTFSNRFKTILPEILNVPYFTGVRMHAGNTKADTDGCILLGIYYDKGQIGSSRITTLKFIDTLQTPAFIEIQ